MRLARNSDLVCNIDLDWNQDGVFCRDIVKNNPHSLRYHLMNKHSWKPIPELALRECKTDEDEHKKAKLYLDEPKEWWIDNQIIWSEFRKFHFKKTESNLRKGDKK